MQQERSFTLPPVYRPVTPEVHPEVEELVKRALAWMDAFELREPGIRTLGAMYAEAMAHAVPDGILERMLLAVQLNTTTTILDDLMDTASLPDVVDLGSRAHRALAVPEFRPGAGSGLTDRCLVALHDVGVSWRRAGTPTQVRRLVHGVLDWLQAVGLEAVWRDRRLLPGIDEYLPLRIRTLSALSISALTEMSSGGEIPERELASPTGRALLEAATLATGLSNDLASYDKERQRNKRGLNIVDVLRAGEAGYSLQEAVDEAMRLRDRILTLFLRLYDKVQPSLSQEMRDHWLLWVGFVNAPMEMAFQHRFLGSASTVHWTDRPADPNTDPLPYPAISWWWDQVG
jgi:Terpene synthase family 2, C-terminal metal binding